MRAVKSLVLISALSVMSIAVASVKAAAQDNADDLSKAVANPLAALISVPVQGNVDFGGGTADDGTTWSLKIQPVVPFALSDDLTLISRTIAPLTYATDVFPSGNVNGLGDVTQAFYFTPKPEGGVTWGIGPQFLLPTATVPELGTGKYGAGVTGIVVVDADKLTMGALIGQMWSVAGDPTRDDVSLMNFQPFVTYHLENGQSVGVDFETTYDWINDQWTVPINLTYTKVFTIGEQAMSGVIGVRKYFVAPGGGPDWGVRAGLTFLFPS
jgi:hypothetical protein